MIIWSPATSTQPAVISFGPNEENQFMQPAEEPKRQGILATVIQSKDPDIAAGTKVFVTGFTAVVPKVFRQSAIGAPALRENQVLAFEWDDIQFDDKGAAIVLETVTQRIAEALDKAKTPTQDGSGMPYTIVGRVQYLAAAYNELAEQLASGAFDEQDRVAQLPDDTKLLPEVWATLLGYDVMDWDGWNDVYWPANELPEGQTIKVGRYLGVPCDRLEFERRVVHNTVKNLGELANRARRPANPPTPAPQQPDNPGIDELCLRYPQLEKYIAVLEREAGRKREQTMQVSTLTKERRKLPTTRPGMTHKFDIAGQKGYITLGFYDPDCKQPGEIFISVQKQGSTLQGFANAWARSLSMLLQYGVPAAEVARMFAWHKFEPRGLTDNPDIREANSIVDYVARWLGYACVAGYTAGGDPTSITP